MKNIILSMPILRILDESDNYNDKINKIFKQFSKIDEELKEVAEETLKFNEIYDKFMKNSNELNEFNLNNSKTNMIGELFDLLQATLNLISMFDLDKEAIKEASLNHINKLIKRKWEIEGHVNLNFCDIQFETIDHVKFIRFE